MQNQDTLVLNDGYSNGFAETLTGPGSELAFQFAATPQAGYGYYSPYIGAVREIIGVLNSIHRARYQYIPALAAELGDRLRLILNAPPSFHNPKSVLVASLPAIADVKPPILHRVASDVPLCASAAKLVLPVTGAPLAFATGYAHDMQLRVTSSSGGTVDLPARASAEQGGFVVATPSHPLADLEASSDAVLHGRWGFADLPGPTFHLEASRSGDWQVGDDPVQIAAGSEVITLVGGAAACVTAVSLRPDAGKVQPVAWKAAAADTLKLTLPLATFDAGKATLLVAQSGAPDDVVSVTAEAGRTHVDGFDLHAGDDFGTLSGHRLDAVTGLAVGVVSFTPGPMARSKGHDALRMTADGSAENWTTGRSLVGRVQLVDGRTRVVKTIVGPPRPVVSLLAKSLDVPPSTSSVTIRLADADQLPHDARLTFSMRIGGDKRLEPDDTLEVATATGSGSTKLTSANGLVLQDAHVAVADIDLEKVFGPSVFGPLQFRIDHQGVASDWQPLGTLVRLPKLHHLRCPAAPSPCLLSGSELFLILSVSATPGFANAVDVPDGYPNNVLTVPRPIDGRLFLRLRDNPAAIGQMIGHTGQ